jgi:hypothetical protein
VCAAHGPWLTQCFYILFYKFAREDKGQLYMWGSNEAGRLGNGRSTEGVTRTPKLVPAFADIHQARCLGVSIGPRHALAISSTSSPKPAPHNPCSLLLKQLYLSTSGTSSSLPKAIGAALDSPDFADVSFMLEDRYTVRYGDLSPRPWLDAPCRGVLTFRYPPCGVGRIKRS